MLKKYMIFGSVALLLAALFAMTGCSQATDGGTTYLVAENHLYGKVDVTAVGKAVAAAEKYNRTVVLTDGLEITGGGVNATNLAGVADFGTVTVRVEGHVKVTGGVILNGAAAALEFAESSDITLTGGAVFIYSGTHEKIIYTTSDPGVKAQYVADADVAPEGEETAIAVDKYSIGEDVAPWVDRIYVLEEITVDASSTPPTGAKGDPRIIALGNVILKGNPPAGFFDGDKVTFALDARLLNGTTGAVAIAVPAAGVALPKIEAENPIVVIGASANIASLQIESVEGPVTISPDTEITKLILNDVTAKGKVTVDTPTITEVQIVKTAEGGSVNLTASTAIAGPVTITANAGAINIRNTATAGTIAAVVAVTSNSGSITFDAASITGGVTVTSNSKDLIFAVPSITTKPVKVTTNSGNITFSKDITSLAQNMINVPANSGTITFGKLNGVLGTGTGLIDGSSGTVVFNGATTLTASVINCNVVVNGALTLSGTMTFGGNVTLPLGHAITASANDITLKSGKAIQVGALTETTTPVPVLAAGGKDVVLTPGGATVLSAIPPADLEDTEAMALSNRTLHITDVAISSFTNNLVVKAGGILSVDILSGINVLGTSTLTLEPGSGAEGAILAFPTISGFATVALGSGGAIAGVNASTADEITQYIARDGEVILGAGKISGEGATLAVLEDGGNGVIGVSDIKLEGVNLDLSLNGNVNVNTSGTLTLAGAKGLVPAASITLAEVTAEPATYVFDGEDIGLSTGTGAISGRAVLYSDETESAVPADIQKLAASASDVIISGGTSSTNISMDSATVILP